MVRCQADKTLIKCDDCIPYVIKGECDIFMEYLFKIYDEIQIKFGFDDEQIEQIFKEFFKIPEEQK